MTAVGTARFGGTTQTSGAPGLQGGDALSVGATTRGLVAAHHSSRGAPTAGVDAPGIAGTMTSTASLVGRTTVIPTTGGQDHGAGSDPARGEDLGGHPTSFTTTASTTGTHFTIHSAGCSDLSW